MIQEIPYQDLYQIFSFFHTHPGTVFLDSALSMSECGRFSYIGVDPYAIIRSKNGDMGDPFDLLQQALLKFPAETVPDLPPFQGGAIGYFGYELHQHLEKIPFAKKDDMNFPDMIVGLYDLIISFDNQMQKAWIVSTGFPEEEKPAQMQRATKRLSDLISTLTRMSSTKATYHSEQTERNVSHSERSSYQAEQSSYQAEQSSYQVEQSSVILSEAKDLLNVEKSLLLPPSLNFTKETYQQSVQIVKDYILAGDIFQANISQRFHLPKNISPFELYSQLRTINPAPFSAYLNFNDVIIASASPERFLKLQNKHVETRPIKGTRPRGKNPAEDKQFADELLQSQKDHAENTMIVDLMRNDLSRVCEKNSIKVPQHCGLESYATVHHLVSVVEGKLKQETHAIDLLKATFPGGSVTGAPKIRAMEIIAKIEPTQRGPYCGAIGYIGFNGCMDTSITIRTYCIKDDKITFQTGGAVVLESDPLKEYEETLTKASALIKTYDTCNR